MPDIKEILEKARNFDKDGRIKEIVEKAKEKHLEFLKLYPFRERKEEIDNLTPEKIFNPKGEYFFYWIEHALKNFGRISVGSSQVWENAKNNPEKLKELLKIVVDDTKSISEKIDADWESIAGFGGDRLIAKKIVLCYYPDKIIPILSTNALEHFTEVLGIDYKNASLTKFNKSYESLLIGEKFSLMNELLLEFKNRYDEFKQWDNNYFAKFLWENFPPPKKEWYLPPYNPIENKNIRLILLKKFQDGKLFADIIEKIFREKDPKTYMNIVKKILEEKFNMRNIPAYEQEVIFIFSKIHKELGFPCIIELRSKFPDCIVTDSSGKEKKIEFEYFSSDFNHDPKECDYIVCWENNLSKEALQKLPKVISLEEFILENFL